MNIVVGYTEAAATELNGDFVTEHIQRIIRAAILEANRTYGDNRLAIELSMRDVENVRYVEETGTHNESAHALDLINLLGADVNTLDRLRSNGEDHDADIVILVTHYPEKTPEGIKDSGCGQAGAIFADNIDNSVAVVRDACLQNNMSLPHEIGHLQGACHNPEADPNNNPFTYQHGYFDAAEHQRTVMSYNNAACFTTGNLYGCIRTGVWSDPNDTFFGATIAPAGTEHTHFNAKILYGSAQHISSLRGDVQRYDNHSSTGFFNWAALQVSKIFNQGDTMDISATFDEPIHEDHPPIVTISDSTLITPIEMDKNT